MNIEASMNGSFVAGEISFETSDGQSGSFHNDTMLDHVSAAIRTIGGDMSGSIERMGIGTSVSEPGNHSLSNMTSIEENGEFATVVDVGDDPAIADEVVVNGQNYANVAGITFEAQFGEQAQKLNNQKISEIALFTQAGDMFARRIIPQRERIPRERGIKITYKWTIFYGVNNPEGN